MKLIVAVFVFLASMFFGLVIIANGVLAGRYETMLPYTAGAVCHQGEELSLEKSTSTSGGTVVVDGYSYDTGFTENTLYCVNQTTGDKREVTNEAYNEVIKLQKRIGWWATIGIFVIIMLPILVFWSAILKRFDRLIGYKPT